MKMEQRRVILFVSSVKAIKIQSYQKYFTIPLVDTHIRDCVGYF